MPYFYKLVGWVYCKRKVRINFCMRGNAAAAAYIFLYSFGYEENQDEKEISNGGSGSVNRQHDILYIGGGVCF